MGLPSAEHLKSDVDPEVKRKAAIARLARWKAITSVVQMKQVAIDDVFSLAPLTLLELSHVGRGNFFDTLSRGTQTQDDSCTVEIQTEHVRHRCGSLRRQPPHPNRNPGSAVPLCAYALPTNEGAGLPGLFYSPSPWGSSGFKANLSLSVIPAMSCHDTPPHLSRHHRQTIEQYVRTA
jgi:hypothetical protein